MTRASLLEPLGQKPRSVLMLATDAAFSRERLSLDLGEGLGQWEEKVWPDLFIAQSGVYWPPSDLALSVKSRGAPRSVIGPAAPRFQEAFTEWLDVLQRPGAMECVLRERLIPSVPVTVRVFNGCRLAMARGKPWLAGRWEDVTRHVSFEWQTKRDPMRVEVRMRASSALSREKTFLSSPKAKGTNQSISTGSSRSQGRAAARWRSMRIRCLKACPISSRSCRRTEMRARYVSFGCRTSGGTLADPESHIR